MQTRSASICILLLFVMMYVWVVSGCGRDARGSAAENPLHHHLVCLAPADGQPEACEGPVRHALFNTWVKEAISLPHSTFSVWTVEPVRHQYRHFFTACIPSSWSNSVWKAKAAFMVRARQGLSDTKLGQAVPEHCRPPEPKTAGIHQLTVSPAVAPLMGDVLDNMVSAPVGLPLHYAVVCDRSDSTLGTICTPDALLRVFDRWVAEGLAQPGASLAVEMVGSLQDSLRSVYHVTIPDLSVGERVAFVFGERIELAQLLEGSGEKYASTIAEAISATVRRLRERNGRYRLFVLSDLHQITSGVWNFDQAVPSSPNFILWLKKTQRFSDLRNIPVLACGMHTGHFGSYSAAHATRLHDLWQSVFEASGAPEVKLYSSCDAGFAAL